MNQSKNLLLVAFTLFICNSSQAQFKGLKDKIAALKGPTTVEGILGMTPEDVKKCKPILQAMY